MLIAYTNYHDPRSENLDLCLIPERPDQYAFPLKVSALRQVENAIIRVSALEGIKVKQEGEATLIVTPVEPAPMFITPSYPDLPGIRIKLAKFIFEPNIVRVFFTLPAGKAEWREWRPNEM